MCLGVVTLVEAILVLLALGTAAGHAVELVHETAAAARLLVLVLVLVGVVASASGELVEQIHDDD